jgi:23S rRNA pseudouridine2605 synthase
VRLAKYLAHAGVASRRSAEQLVFGGRVRVAGEEVRDPARDVGDSDEITVDGRRVGGGRPAARVVYAVHKPPGVVSTAHDPQGRRTVVSLVPTEERLYPVGRLDADTTGLILLTNDGDLAYRLTHPSFEVPKRYRATVRRPPVGRRALDALRTGVVLDDGPTAPALVRRLAPDVVELTIHEGRKRQVRRMLDAVGHPVVSLERVGFGPLELGRLPEGAHRRLREEELRALREAPGGGARRARGARPHGGR